jgi:GT2 family glycosyltransferase
MNDTAILIVTYNSAQEIGPCLEAALRTEAEIWVIDNASADTTCAVVAGFPVHLIANPKNCGFAGAVNQGVRACKAKYLLLLNPDAVLTGGIEELRFRCEPSVVGATAGVLIGQTGQPQAGFTVRRLPTAGMLSFEVLGLNRLLPQNALNWRFRCFDLDLNTSTPLPVEQPAGALFMFRREVWEALSGFDEQFYPLWFEDVDFCTRLRSLGKTILLIPNVTAKHTGAHSILNMTLEIRESYWYGNLLKYAAKHFSPSGRKLVCVSVFLGAVLRFLTGMPVRGMRDVAVWRKVGQLAFRCFFGRPGWENEPNGGASA